MRARRQVTSEPRDCGTVDTVAGAATVPENNVARQYVTETKRGRWEASN